MASAARNPELRKDTVLNKWVIFSPARARRPSDFKSKAPVNPNSSSSSECPFCIGHEHDCAPEIFRVPTETSDWKLRVIENMYPALKRDEGLVENKNPNPRIDFQIPGFGFHDVVIESPIHSVHLSDLSALGVGDVLLAQKERIKQLSKYESIKYVQVFKNHGASAGASMSHSHSQIMGLPVVPPTVSSRLQSTKEYFEETGKCGLCEVRSDELLIEESTHFFSIVPFAASYPFEIWIIPREHSSHFHEIDNEKLWMVGRLTIAHRPSICCVDCLAPKASKSAILLADITANLQAVDLGYQLKLMLLKLSRQLNDPPFNFMIHTSPLEVEASQLPYSHWFLQIVPQLSTIAGFEIGSGCYINPVFPEEAVKVLREVDVPM